MKTFGILLLGTTLAHAQLAVTVSPVKVIGQKAVVPLAMKNGLSQTVESARAVVFLLDEQGRAQCPPVTRWVISGGLAPGATNVFHFVITGEKPFGSTNLTAKVDFSRVVLEGGRIADVQKDVQIQSAAR